MLSAWFKRALFLFVFSAPTLNLSCQALSAPAGDQTDNSQPSLRGPLAAPGAPGSGLPAGGDPHQLAPGSQGQVIKLGVQAQPPRVLTVLDALDDTLINSPRAAAIRCQLGITRANYAAATAWRNPGFFMDQAPLGEAVSRIGPVMNWTPPWQLAFDLLVARREVIQTKLEILRDLWSLRSDARRAYTEVVVAQETADALRQLVELASRVHTIAQKRFDAGAVPEFDVYKAKLALSQAELALAQGRQRVVKAKQRLNLLMGKKAEDALEVPSLAALVRSPFRLRTERNYFLPNLQAQLPALDDFFEEARKCRFELKVVKQQIAVNKANVMNSYGNIIPNGQLALGSSAAGNAPSGPKIKTFYFTLLQELPITNIQQGDIARYKAVGKQLLYQLAATENQVDSDVSAAYQDVLTYRERIRLYQDHVLADSQEVARLARRSYEVGHTDITGVIQAQQANFQTELQYVMDVQAYQQAYIDLEQSVGRPLQ